MRTKQLRLTDPAQIRGRMREFIGKKINIVLSDRTVMFGELTKVNDTAIIVTNMRLEKASYQYESIVEVYSDARV